MSYLLIPHAYASMEASFPVEAEQLKNWMTPFLEARGVEFQSCRQILFSDISPTLGPIVVSVVAYLRNDKGERYVGPDGQSAAERVTDFLIQGDEISAEISDIIYNHFLRVTSPLTLQGHVT